MWNFFHLKYFYHSRAHQTLLGFRLVGLIKKQLINLLLDKQTNFFIRFADRQREREKKLTKTSKRNCNLLQITLVVDMDYVIKCIN